MKKKIIITEEQSRKIAECNPQKLRNVADSMVQERFLYHRGHVDSMENPTPYASEDRWRKFEGAGHETGSFGSGMYFTDAYPRDDRWYRDDDKSAVMKRERENPGERRFIKIGDSLYSVDTEFYKNLYVIKSENEAKTLCSMMEAINSFARTFNYPSKDNMKWRQYKWLQISNIANMLGLRMPWTYREMCEFSEKYCKDTSIRQTPATVFMELNGFNGVDASYGGKYNSYWQGSVIYDLSKVEQHIEPVLGPRDEFKIRHGNIVRTMYDDVLDQSDNPTHYRKDGSLGQNDNPSDIIKALKRYPYILPKYRYFSLPNELKPVYLDVLYRNLRTGYINMNGSYYGASTIKELTEDVYLDDIFKYKKFKFINLSPTLTRAIVMSLSWRYNLDKNTALGFINTYQGNLAKDYPEDWEFIKDEYGF